MATAVRAGRPWAAAVVLAAALAGCAADREASPALAGACQFKPCVCADTRALFWQAADTVPPLWRENGEPYCPPDFALVRVPEKKKR
ncbi:MAG: hypothetical protein ACFCUO_04210 [Rhodospirillales bacterium]